MTIAENILTVKKCISAYEAKYHREKGSVSLLAVSKGQSVDKIRAAIASGQTAFGENYLQEAINKIAALADQPIEWHFIGHLQSNKTQKIAEYFSWVHSLNNKKNAQRLNDQRSPLLPQLNVCIEVNLHHEPGKSGVPVDEVKSLMSFCQQLPRLTVRGLMAIPTPQKNMLEQRKSFHELYELWHHLREEGFALDTISAGMSNDFEAAIAEGATLVRLGTIIFGTRKS